MLAEAPIFPTYVVGSLPRDEWVLDVLRARDAGILNHADADRILDGAALSAIRMQEQAGLDYVSDGEVRRNTYLHVFIDAVDGYEPDVIPSGPFSTSSIPAIVSPIVQRRPICGNAPEYLAANAVSRTVAALPSPYTLGVTMWTAERSSAAYGSPVEAMRACARIINAEVKRLAASGVDVVQLDEPWLGDVVNPEYRRAQGIPDLDRELALYVEAVNSSFEGVEGVSTAVHVCGHSSTTSPGSRSWPYDILFEALGRMNADRFTVAMSGLNTDGFQALRHYPKGKVLGLGVLNTAEPVVDTPDEIVGRVERAMEHAPLEQIALNPDCGFAPYRRNRRSIDDVYLKLKAMCGAAETLRARYG